MNPETDNLNRQDGSLDPINNGALPNEPLQMPIQEDSTTRPTAQIPDGSPLLAQPINPPQRPFKRKRRMILTFSLIFLILLASVGTSLFFYTRNQNKPNEEPIKVGLMMAFSGGSASMGYGVNKGIQLAKKQLGASNIEIIQLDSKCDPKTAAEVVKELIAQGVVAIIGEGCSSATVAALPAANNARVPIISPSASSPTLSIPNDYFFRVVPPDDFQGAFMANAIFDRGYRKVAVVYTNEPYGSGIHTVFRESFEELGGTIIATAAAEPDVIDLQNLLEPIKDANPEAVFIAPNSIVTATAASQIMRSLGIEAPFYGADILYDESIISNDPSSAEGSTISTFYTGDTDFKRALFNESQRVEQLYAAPQAYDIINILQLAAQSGARTGEDIKNFLLNVELDGESGFTKFDENGEISSPDYKYDLFQIQNGTFTLLEE